MNYNRKFIPKVWESPRQVHSVPPFVNSQQNFFQNQGNPGNNIWNNSGNSNFNQNFQQNQNIRPLLHLNTPIPDNQPFRKFNNDNVNNQEYRRPPGPACSRNNYG